MHWMATLAGAVNFRKFDTAYRAILLRVLTLRITMGGDGAWM